MNRKTRTTVRSAVLATGVATVVAGVGMGFENGAHAANETSAHGWSAVIADQDGVHSLRMVSPQGRAVTIGDVSDDAPVADVSNDGSKVLTTRQDAATGQTRLTLWNTHAKSASHLRLSGSWQAAYTADGVLTWSSGKGELVKRDFTGTVVASLPMEKSSRIYVPGDGSKFVESSTDYLTVRKSSDGATLNELRVPDGECAVDGEWSDSTFASTCAVGDGIGATRSFEMPYTGGHEGRPLTSHGSGRVLGTTPVTAAHASGTDQSDITAASSTSWAPLDPKLTGEPTGAWGTQIYLLTGDADGRTLSKRDLSTGRTSVVHGGLPQGIEVVDAQTIDGRR